MKQSNYMVQTADLSVWFSTFFAVNPNLIGALLASVVVLIASDVRQNWQKAVAAALSPIILYQLVNAGLLFSYLVTPRTIDASLYSFEAALGYPAAWTAQFLLRHAVFETLSWIAYSQLLFVAAILWALSPRQERAFQFYAALGFFGWLGYLAMPAAGPMAINPNFVADPTAALLPGTPLGIAYNCMPSLHTAWLMAVWWGARELGWQLRWIFRFYCSLALVYTLGVHYGVDLVVSVPFTYGVKMALDRDWRALMYLAMVLGWFVALRAEILSGAPAIAWASVGLTLALSPLIARIGNQTAGQAVNDFGSYDAAAQRDEAPERVG